jgi:endonuclease/exonuclease/phosphatase family metal-dependent hydrolase
VTALRLVTYNVRRCLGMDGELSPKRIATVLATCRPDIIALQELDVGRARTLHVDQAREIALALNMQVHFHPALRIFEEQYGDAVLTPFPSELVKAAALPVSIRSEARGALWVRIAIGGVHIDVINTHLGLRMGERAAQIQTLLGRDWVGGCHPKAHVILTGDFNCVPRSRSYRQLTSHLVDAQTQCPIRACATFPSALPMARIDYAFVSQSIRVLEMAPVRSAETRLASDHLPLLMVFSLGGDGSHER